MYILLRDIRETPGTSFDHVKPVTWPTLARHLEASPWAGLYDESDDFIHRTVRGDTGTRSTIAPRLS